MAVAPTRTPSTILELGQAGTSAGLCLSYAPRSSPAVGPIPANGSTAKLGQSCCVRRLGTSAHDVNLFKTQIATAQASRPLWSFTRSLHVGPVARPCRHLLLPRA